MEIEPNSFQLLSQVYGSLITFKGPAKDISKNKPISTNITGAVCVCSYLSLS